MEELNRGLFGIYEDYWEPDLSLDQFFEINSPQTFFFRHTGQEMSPWIREGELLIVKRGLDFSKGFWIVSEGEKWLCRYLEKKEGQILMGTPRGSLQALSSQMDFFGKVIASIRDFR